MILRGELDLSCALESPFSLRFPGRFVLGTLRAVFLSFIESDGGFQDQEHVVPSALDFADRLGNPVGFGQRVVDRVPQFLH